MGNNIDKPRYLGTVYSELNIRMHIICIHLNEYEAVPNLIICGLYIIIILTLHNKRIKY